MDSPLHQIDISKLILNRKLFLVWILVVFLPFALVITIFSSPNLFLIEGITGISGVDQTSTFSSVIFSGGPENLAPQPMLVLPIQLQKADASAMHSLLLNDGMNKASSFENISQIKQIKVNDGEGKASKSNQSGKCNLFKGKWVHDPEGPLYTNETCAHIQGHQNCMRNGRPDKEYLYWRWKPNGCDLPRFNATLFLELVRGKVWAFVGDSVARNQMQSLLCMLSKVEHPNNTYKDKDNIFVHWYFPSYNFTLMVLWSPYLVKVTKEEFKGVPSGVVKLHLDVLDPEWVTLLPNTDALVLSTGHWFLQSGVYIMKDEVVGCHNCQGVNATQLGFYFAFRHAIRAALEGINLLPGFQGIAFLQTFTVDHFENGQWSNGGTCNRTEPYKKGEVKLDGVNKEMHKIVIEEFKNGTKEEAPNGAIIKLMDITYCGLLRPDGHPGKYRDLDFLSANKANQPVPNDCLHWCLPGPIDAWNEILFMKLKEL
ncbi:hypothetical protein SUGI_0879240 [Cryptomeria japonica]|uniref:protein trichome birefringence-like 24 n=1 Tax=Cryptomeria japonica TaxID=3369 RepID=UPI00241497F8|nr:protein trichome birefringence-like 24 [Cryptomeria japonica]GLJ42434.1 hypothetical protein SUGI_0879240 [Cryptomeria japonica]